MTHSWTCRRDRKQTGAIKTSEVTYSVHFTYESTTGTAAGYAMATSTAKPGESDDVPVLVDTGVMRIEELRGPDQLSDKLPKKLKGTGIEALQELAPGDQGD